MNNFDLILRSNSVLANLASDIVVKVAKSNFKNTGSLKKREKTEISILFSFFRKKMKKKNIAIPISNKELYNSLIRPWFFKRVHKAK